MTELENIKDFRSLDHRTRQQRMNRRVFGGNFAIASLIVLGAIIITASFAHFFLVQLPFSLR